MWNLPPIASGQWSIVTWACETSGKAPAHEFFLHLDVKDRARIQALFERLAESGRIRTSERFKKLETRGGVALWEFKSFQLRFIGTYSSAARREFVVACGLQKKQQRHNARDLDRAVRILKEHFSRPEPGGG